MMNYWLIKSDPDTYSWEAFEKDKTTYWDGVRNYAARIHLRAMKKGDMCLFYESVKKPSVLGTCKVVKEAYQDPTTEDDRWVAVDVQVGKKFKEPVPLKQIKEEKPLKDMILLKISRLSVQPVLKKEYEYVLKMGGL